jgi:hypothetical protein
MEEFVNDTIPDLGQFFSEITLNPDFQQIRDGLDGRLDKKGDDRIETAYFALASGIIC